MTNEILDPTGQAAVAEGPVRLSQRPVEIRGSTIGLVDTGKQNAGLFVENMGEVLVDRFGAGRLVVRKKPIATVESPSDLLTEVAAEADLVVIAVGDCGSCSAAAIADGIALERLGTPAAVVCTESFRATADAMASLKGASGYRYATVAHPIAGLPPEQVRARVEAVADEVVSLLVDPAAGRGAA